MWQVKNGLWQVKNGLGKGFWLGGQVRELTKLFFRATKVDPKQTPLNGFVCNNDLVDLVPQE